MTAAPTVSVAQGQLRGRVVTNPIGITFYSFQGVPYAKPPIGALRFKDPQAPEEWQGIRDATAEGNNNPHSKVDYFGNRNYFGDEDCLFLNVYTPNLEKANLPVMIFIQGDGFKFGSGNIDLGPDYLVAKDVVIITLNYRSGVFGFLSLNIPEVPGNAGMKDIASAIKWVKSNIHNFGGNPENITIFGQGAGGAAVSYLTVSQLTKKLISKAIIQSGTAFNFWALQRNPEDTAASLAKMLGCKSADPEQILEHLRNCSAIELVKGYDDMISNDDFLGNFSPFGPVIENYFAGVEAFIYEPFSDLVRSGRIADVPVMIGTCGLEFSFEKNIDDLQVFIPEEINVTKNSKESLAIVQKLKQLYLIAHDGDSKSLDGYSHLACDRAVKTDIVKYIKYLVEVDKQPVYYYNFDYTGAFNISRKKHATLKQALNMDELGYLFRSKYQEDIVHSARDVEMRERMLRLWTNFAKTGKPTPDKEFYLSVLWSPVSRDKLNYLNISSELSLESNQDREKSEFWQDLYIKERREKMLNNINIDPTTTNGVAEQLIRANDPIVADLPKNVGVNKFVNFYESLQK
ncbi:unnamed protein product [Arctia plantaginis]|uniref:Carboxylesterase type B domain-containing protein n=1 Tax=Arctia plantaginis TaxID=874455 RepID=A0A8S1BJV0_ARCPL|nr:unnamed protein product [Arctia plantaginis]